MTISNFNDVFAAVVGVEGGYSADPQDPGNWTGGAVGQGQLGGTKYGISAAAFPNVDIVNLTLQQAQALAKQKYWDVWQCDQFDIRVGYLLFDIAYNGGHPAQWLQQAVGVTVDGVIGAKTIGAVRSFDPLKVCMFLAASRFDYWLGLNLWPTYGKGWTHRGVVTMRTIAAN